jgi:adenylate cyclase
VPVPRLTLRRKLLLFAIAIAVAPILLAGQTIIRIAQDELKSSANEQLLGIAGGIAREVNDVVERSWLEPLVLLRNALDDDRLGVQEKIALLTLGISDIADIVALQLTVEGTDLPLVVVQDAFSARLRAAGLDPLEVLRVPPESVDVLRAAADVLAQDVTPVAATDDWLATVVLPLGSRIAGADATLTARIDLHRLRELVSDDPFTRSGFITVVDRTGHEVFDPERRDLGGYAIVAEAIGALSSTSRSLGVSPYPRPDGEVMLGAYAFPRPFKWAVLVERRQRDAYLAVERMTRSLVLWGSAGLAVAVLGAIALAFAISRPILEIDRVAAAVAGGDLTARVVRGVRLNDEIGGLARRINGMIVGLTERLHLEKFVSGGTMAAIRLSEHRGVRLGGTRCRATMLFCDIRGYTAFAEEHEPDLVVEVLNFYFQHLTGIVKQHGGDIDKFVGDQILAVFVGGGSEANAVRCALAMQARMGELGADRPGRHLAVGIGVSTGEVVMGAMGSPDRMDYTVLGDAVNLAARLCSRAERGQVLVSRSTCEAVAGSEGLLVRALAPVQIKGKREPVAVYEAEPRPAAELADDQG